MHMFESSLNKKIFFERISEMNLQNVLVIKTRQADGEKEIPAGFIIDGVGVLIFISHYDSVWVTLRYGKKVYGTVEKIIEHLKLNPDDQYPFVVEYPSKEVMDVWRKNKNG